MEHQGLQLNASGSANQVNNQSSDTSEVVAGRVCKTGARLCEKGATASVAAANCSRGTAALLSQMVRFSKDAENAEFEVKYPNFDY